MNDELDSCPHCGNKVLKGAMRCPSCGKIIKTAEEQKATIEKLQTQKKSFNIFRTLRIIVFIIIAYLIYRYFLEDITAFLNRFFNE